jgi:xanthine dehydrogenase accessory factor
MGMLVLIKGAGDMASGVALRIYRAGFDVAMTDMEKPTAIRRTVCFSEAIRLGQTHVEDVLAKRAYNAKEARRLMSKRIIPVIADEDCSIKNELLPDVIVDAILAKRNINTKIDDAGIVIALGPGFCASRDCHAVIETQRGHDLGRVIRSGSAAPNTGIPGIIAGYGAERVLRAPADGLFMPKKSIGDIVKAGDCVAEVSGEPMLAAISGVLRGLLPEGSSVHKGMKSGDIDPRGIREYCLTVSDKSMAVAGGVLEAILSLSRRL